MRRSLIPWEAEFPRTLSGFRREMDRLFDQFFRDTEGTASETFTPQTNVAETENDFEVTLDLPGIKPEDFDIELQGGQLVVRGEKKQEKEEKDKTFHRVERYHGTFRRVIPLPADVNEEKVTAQYTDGVLKIIIPKAERAKPKKITVKGD